MFEKVLEFSTLIKSRISVFLLLPFWYLCIYLFDIELFNSSDLILKVVICFCISFPAEAVFSLYAQKLIEYKIKAIKETGNLKEFPKG